MRSDLERRDYAVDESTRAVGWRAATASLQSTQIAQRVYAALGLRDLGRILEYVPPFSAAASSTPSAGSIAGRESTCRVASRTPRLSAASRR